VSGVATTNEVLQELTAWCERLRAEAGSRLPSERALAKELNASRSTVRRALNILAEDGIITIIRGRSGGAYLADTDPPEHQTQGHARRMGALATISADGRSVHRGLQEMTGIPQLLLDQDSEIDNRVLSLTLEAPDADLVSLLDIKPTDPVISLLRLRFVDGAPFSLEHMYLSFARFPRLLDEGLRGARSLYTLLQERHGVSITSAEEEVHIAPASPEAAHLLGIAPGDAVLTLRRRACDIEGRPVECSYDMLRGDRARLTIHTLTSANSIDGLDGLGGQLASWRASQESTDDLAIVTRQARGRDWATNEALSRSK
jgi:DNA-binding GntR family transcriptional regulator